MTIILVLMLFSLGVGLRAGTTGRRPRAWYLVAAALLVSTAFMRLGTY